MGGRKEEKTMTIISTEMLKWKRNKTVLGIFILTAILGIFAVERAFSISRSSSLMNSFSDLYTLAFKNLTSLFLPIVLSMFATTLFFDEQKNDTLKGLLIIPISKTQLYFSKIHFATLLSASHVMYNITLFLLCKVFFENFFIFFHFCNFDEEKIKT